MAKNNLLLFMFIVFMQFNIQAQTEDTSADVVAYNDENELSGATKSATDKVLTEQELAEKDQLEREAKLYAARQAVLKKLSFIETNQNAFTAQVNNFNASLEACRCGKEISDPNDERELAKMTVLEIRTYFIEKNINITKIYMTSLNSCKK
ncbi:hypothetical protein N7U66_18505 [Lacinutrix neustonica]|uniref:Uncharacterized protein n=1 Tax=Lacinutrix neustonica TaxID=2980107 RepID=A0A9E8MWE8_9FLAO|nr:hypothetical protein [Lacinutrix neustonica]WAC01842.1 hypothetical protein N7U66_18505 [Lacinutrix neustonica]